jgi:voltage-gated potassium channel
MKSEFLWIVLQRMRLPFSVILITYTIAMIGLLIIPGVDDKGNEYYLSIFDAFYFITYTATTIGFGEIPYPFTEPQRIWVSISIYITVLGWFYSIGALIALVQDRLFLNEISRARFIRLVKGIKEDFVIILGYNDTTSIIIKKMIDANMRVVVIEKDQSRADHISLEGFIPHVPILVADAHNPNSLEWAGIKSFNCKGIISLFESNALNMRITLASRILNPHVKIAVKSSTNNETYNLLDAGANIVENPLEIITYQIQMALKAPSVFKIENWLYNIDTLEGKTFAIPKEDILICGYGRLGKSIYEMFQTNGIQSTIIEIDEEKVNQAIEEGNGNIVCGNAEDKLLLENVKMEEMKLVIIATDDDTTNLSIASTVKRINKKALIVSRENELADFSIFSNAKIDHLFLPSEILINKTTNAIINPLSDRMIRLLTKKDEQFGQQLLSRLIKCIHNNPMTYELILNKMEAVEAFEYMKSGQKLKLFDLRRSRRDRNQHNNVVPLLIVRCEEDRCYGDALLPSWDFELRVNDHILFACDENARDDIEYIVNNMYEFHYIVKGEEDKSFRNFVKNIIKDKKDK